MLRWSAKFKCALRGLRIALRAEDSFRIHLPAAVAVLVACMWLRVPRGEAALLALLVLLVLGFEMLNTAIERLARAVTNQDSPHIRDALDIASGAVLAASLGAAVVGVAILWPRLW